MSGGISGLVPVRTALLSVSDKTEIVELAQELAGLGIFIVSTGGTAEALQRAGIAVRLVENLTGFPEMLDGRVKTLHPAVHGGLLARRTDPAHLSALAAHGIDTIDLLVVNLYPFENTTASGAGYDTCVENIDIGGPALIRAAAKNHESVAVVTAVEDYAGLIAELRQNGGSTRLVMRKTLAAKAYARTAAYDAAISAWFNRVLDIATPERLTIAGSLIGPLRYGENPHQSAAFYRDMTAEKRPGVATARLVQGKELSYNNINDTDAAFELVSEFAADESAAVAIIKHANPCGVAVADNLLDAYRRALACDPVSAFGGIIALNRPLDADTATEITRIFTEVIIAPDASAGAMTIMQTKKNLRLLLTGSMPCPSSPGLAYRSVAAGFLVQSRDNLSPDAAQLRVVSKRQPFPRELADMLFAFRVAKHVKSNAVVYAKNTATVAIGAGQMSRVDSVRIAAWKAQEAAAAAGVAEPLTHGSVVASDAFFPFADGLIAAADAGATAIIQPGGSMRDDEVIAAADARDLAMVFTGTRHFRH